MKKQTLPKGVEKLSSGSYRYKKMVNGQLIRKTFDHIPNEVEISLLIAEQAQTVTADDGKTFAACCAEYIKIKENILSPGTLNSYESIVRNMSDGFKRLKLSQITQVTVQKEVNDYSATHSAKSTKNFNGFVKSVLRTFKPNIVIRTTLPPKDENKGILPSENDIRTLLDAVKDTEYSIIFQLGVLGLRRSEACALTLDDINGNVLTINKAKVKGRDNQWTIRNYTKTAESTRTIILPEPLVNEIRERGYIYKGSPDTLLKYLHRLQKRYGLPNFKLHSLRHYFASYCHVKGIPDAYVKEMGGWSPTSDIMEKVYQETMDNKTMKMQKKMGKILL